jgi:predicted AAA+ superfamily ATPase
VPGGELFGKAFENWVHHELVAFVAYHELHLGLSYWRLASGIEVDFIVGDMDVAIEAKASARITADHLKGLRHLRADHARARRIVVCLEPKRRVTEDGIEIVPASVFTAELGRLLS